MLRYAHYFTLSTPKQRLVTWWCLTFLIYMARFDWLQSLSLYKQFGAEWMPSVGLTRAYWLLLHGNTAGAWAMNKLIFLVIGVGGAILAKDIYHIAKNRSV